MKKKNLKSLKLNKKSISNFETVSGGFTLLTLQTNANDICCFVDLTGPCNPPRVTKDCLPTEFLCV